ncbi:MAG: GNAT family N-acetyltransferase [Nostocoides sp.]
MGSVRLVPLGPAHVADLEALTTDPDVLRFTYVPDPPPVGFAEAWVDRYETGRVAGSREGFAAYGPDDTFLGAVLAPHIDWVGLEVELGYMVAPAARGMGYAAQMLDAAVAWAFTTVGALRVWLVIDAQNAASERVATKAGFTREGVMRSVHFKQGRRIDAALWSKLPSDS